MEADHLVSQNSLASLTIHSTTSEKLYMLRLTHPQVRLVSTLALTLATFAAIGCSRDPNVRKHKYLESGQRYEKEGKYREAGIQYSNAIKIDRNFGDAHFALSKVYLEMGAIPAAYGELLKAVDLSPNNIQARLDLGNLSLAGGRPEVAAQQVKAILAQAPNSAAAYALQCGISAHAGDRTAAIDEIRHAISLDPANSNYHTTLALLEVSSPDGIPAAEQELNKAISLDNKNMIAHLSLSAVLEKDNDFAGAEREAITATQVAPKSLQARESLAGFYLRHGDSVKVEQLLRQTATDFADSQQGAGLLADYYIRAGDLQKAENAYAEMVADHPKSLQLNFEYARILALRGENDKVTPIAETIKKLAPDSPEYDVVESSTMLTAGKVNDAFDLLQKSVRDAPDNYQLHLALAKVALRKGDFDTASTNFHEGERLNPHSLEVQIGLAQIANAHGDSNALTQAAESALSIDPTFTTAYLWRATAEANQKQFDRAEADLQTVITKTPNNSQAYIELGQIRLLNKQVPQGIELLQKALDIDPNSLPALSQLIRVYEMNKQPDKAVAAVQAQIAKAPANAQFYVMDSALQLQAKNYNGAVSSAQKAYQLNPESEDAVRAFTDAEVALGNPSAAIAVWTPWISKHPKDANATSMVGQLLEQKGDSTGAMGYYQKSLEIDPHQFWALNNLAYLMVTQHQNLDVALSMAQQARTAQPHLANTADTLAWVYYAKGMYGSSRDLLEDAIKSDPNDASIQYHLGMAYSKLGDRSNATLHLKKAIALAPQGEAGKDAAAALANKG
jgi:tetratricopeptide (TPR) repeat protein